jgi:hypothetical protein
MTVKFSHIKEHTTGSIKLVAGRSLGMVKPQCAIHHHKRTVTRALPASLQQQPAVQLGTVTSTSSNAYLQH